MSSLSPQELAERALAAAGPAAVVLVEHTSTADVRWARSTLTTNGERNGLTLTVIAFHERPDGVGTATLSVTGPDAVSAVAVAQAAQAAAAAAPNAADAAPLVRPVEAPSNLDWGGPIALTSAAALTGLTSRLGEALRAGSADAVEHFGYAEHSVTTTWLASATGVRLRWAQPAGRIEMTAKSHERTRSAWQGAASEDLDRIDVQALDAALRRGLAWQDRRIDIAPGRHTAILTAGATADLACDIWWYAAARDAVEGRSVFSRPGGGTRIGERLTDRRISIGTNSADPGMQAIPLDRKSTRLNSSHEWISRMPSSA